MAVDNFHGHLQSILAPNEEAREAGLTSVQAEYRHPPTLQSPVHFSLVLGLGWLLQKRSSTFSVFPSSLLYLEQ